MTLAEQIMSLIKEKKAVQTKEISALSGLSKQTVVGVLNKLIEQKKLIRVGRTNQIRYVLFEDAVRNQLENKGVVWHRRLDNQGLSESSIFAGLKTSSLFVQAALSKEVARIIEHAFTEMLNNAIEHSASPTIEVWFKTDEVAASFEIIDHGIGIFNNVRQTRGLKNDLEATQDIFKGKQTTLPATHSGQGIFFTSKIADTFWIVSNQTEVLVDNTIPDWFIKPHRQRRGTLVGFSIARNSTKKIQDVFNQFTNQNLRFDKTDIKVELFTMDDSFVSRSQARRLLAGLDDFKRVTLDFNRVEFIGQGFADEIFRVYYGLHPDTVVSYIKAKPEVEFMIKRAVADRNGLKQV